MTQEHSILDIDDVTAEAWLAHLAEAVARGDIRMVARDGVAMACLMPGTGHPTTKARAIGTDMAKELIDDAFTRVTSGGRALSTDVPF